MLVSGKVPVLSCLVLSSRLLQFYEIHTSRTPTNNRQILLISSHLPTIRPTLHINPPSTAQQRRSTAHLQLQYFLQYVCTAFAGHLQGGKEEPHAHRKMMMSSPLKKQPEAVADKVLKRVEVSKVRKKNTKNRRR